MPLKKKESKSKKFTLNSKFIKRKNNSQKLSIDRGPSTLRDHAIVADRSFRNVSTSATFYLPVGVAAGNFAIGAASFFQPLNSSRTITAGGFTLTNSSSLTTNPMGYSLLSQLYDQYRVHSCRIKCTVTPVQNADAVICTIYPIPFLSGAAIPPVNPQQTMNNRYSRWKMCTANNNVEQNTIIHAMSSAKVLGMTKEQFRTSESNVMGAYPTLANSEWTWECEIQTVSGAVTAGQVYVSLEIDQFVELQEPIFQSA